LAIAALMAAPWIWQSLVWCAWLGVAGGLALARRIRGVRGSLATLAWSTIAVAIAFHWSPRALAYSMDSIYPVGLLVFAPLLLWDAARMALPFLLAAKLVRRSSHLWLVAGLLSVVLESVVPSVFPFRLGYAQLHWPWLIQASDLFGPEWPTMVIFAIAGAILLAAQASLDAARTRSFSRLPRRLLASPAVWLIVVNLVYSAGAMRYWENQIEQSPLLRVALVQVDPSYRESTADLRRLTSTVSKGVDLVCWPESSAGTYDLALGGLSDAPLVFSHSRDPERGDRPWPLPDCSLLVGAKSYSGDREKPDKFYQTAMLIDRQERIVGRYQKRHLMPFGEFVPGSAWVPGIGNLFNLDEEITAGDSATVLRSDHGTRIGAMLCYEDMVPSAARTLTNERANVLISLINGAAFADRLTLAQHRMLAELRTIECRRSLLRCSSTGETCVISALGKIEDSLTPQSQGVLVAMVPLVEARSLYCRLGDFFPILAGVALLAVGFSRWRAKPGEPTAAVQG
jgi:apolipoprotein N-acyltransferase